MFGEFSTLFRKILALFALHNTLQIIDFRENFDAFRTPKRLTNHRFREIFLRFFRPNFRKSALNKLLDRSLKNDAEKKSRENKKRESLLIVAKIRNARLWPVLIAVE